MDIQHYTEVGDQVEHVHSGRTGVVVKHWADATVAVVKFDDDGKTASVDEADLIEAS